MFPTLLDRSKAMADSKPKKKKKWMKAAVPESHKGIFTAKAKAAGKSVHEYAEEKKTAGSKLGKEANLALTFEKERPKKKAHKSSDHLMSSMYGKKKKG